MPRNHRKSREEFPIDEGKRLREQGYSYQEIAHTIGWSYGQTYRKLKDLPTNGTRADDIPVDMNGVSIDDIPVETVELTPTSNGTPSTPSTPSTPTSLERTIVIGEPVSAPPEYPSTPEHVELVQRVDAHDRRLDVLEAFMQDRLRQPAYPPKSTPSVPEYTTPREWKKSGVEYAVDIPDKLRAYAKAHGMQVREVVDLAIRRLLGEGVDHHA
jgi:hypothetical protein